MDETCDRCGPVVRAFYRVDRTGELYLCRHCVPDPAIRIAARVDGLRQRRMHLLPRPQ